MRFLLRVVGKALLLFLLINVLAAQISVSSIGRISAYNHLFPGRPRFPFGESPREAYNFSLFDIDAMFASHAIAGRQTSPEFRVFLLGDSSVWGTLLRPEETLAGRLNALTLTAAGGRPVRFYNLGYPTISVTKDLLLLDRATVYRPDLIIWLVTLEAFPQEKQLSVPLVANNPTQTTALIERLGLARDTSLLAFPQWSQRTLIGRRKHAADLIRLQVYGVPWAATGIDQVYPTDYPQPQTDLEADPLFHGRSVLERSDLALDVLPAVRQLLPEVPILIVNEPILISDGVNSDVRYNFYYPRAAYDRYREWLPEEATRAGLDYLDAWNIVPVDEFTNSAIHYNRSGVDRVVTALLPWLNQQTQ